VVLPANSLCMGGFFPVCCELFPVIHIWAFVHHSSMFRVVDVLCAVSNTVAEDEWIFFFSVMDFSSSVSWSTPSSNNANLHLILLTLVYYCRDNIVRFPFCRVSLWSLPIAMTNNSLAVRRMCPRSSEATLAICLPLVCVTRL